MSKPVLSLDVSKRSSYAATYLSMHEQFKKPISVPHSPEGLEILLDRLRNMEYLTGERPQVILESTGNYSKPITHSLQEAGYEVIVLNPIQTYQQKRRSIRKVKTDPVDAKRIAEIFYLQKLEAQQLPWSLFQALRGFFSNSPGCFSYSRRCVICCQRRYHAISEL